MIWNINCVSNYQTQPVGYFCISHNSGYIGVSLDFMNNIVTVFIIYVVTYKFKIVCSISYLIVLKRQLFKQIWTRWKTKAFVYGTQSAPLRPMFSFWNCVQFLIHINLQLPVWKMSVTISKDYRTKYSLCY